MRYSEAPQNSTRRQRPGENMVGKIALEEHFYRQDMKNTGSPRSAMSTLNLPLISSPG